MPTRKTCPIGATKPALPLLLPILVAPIRAKGFHKHYNGQPALLSRHCRGTTTLPQNLGDDLFEMFGHQKSSNRKLGTLQILHLAAAPKLQAAVFGTFRRPLPAASENSRRKSLGRSEDHSLPLHPHHTGGSPHHHHRGHILRVSYEVGGCVEQQQKRPDNVFKASRSEKKTETTIYRTYST